MLGDVYKRQSFIIKILMDFQLVAILSSCSLVLGHCFRIFYQFRGGKGIATGTGAVLYQIPILLLVIPIFLIVSVFTRFISLGSIISCISSILIVTVLVITNNLDSEYLIIGVFIPLLIIFNHRQNIKRLIEKKENKFHITKSLDLHGYTLDEANKKVESFITDCFDQKVSKITIVTGKGLHSQND